MYDIVFISYNEPNADKNWESLKQRFPNAKRVDGVKGIHEAHKKAAKKCFTKMFWVVDADADLDESFLFDYEVNSYDLETVHVCLTENPVNGLRYGYGGVKLLPRKSTINLDDSQIDMTTSISNNFKIINQVSNVSRFNTDAFSAWKSGFRECAKLASKTIERQINQETKHRLDVWCNVGANTPYGIDAIRGAKQGKQFGLENRDNPDVLSKINDFDWLKERFSKG